MQEFKNKQSFIDSLKVRDGKIVREQKVVHAVNDISFTIAEGEAFSLVGRAAAVNPLRRAPLSACSPLRPVRSFIAARTLHP